MYMGLVESQILSLSLFDGFRLLIAEGVGQLWAGALAAAF